MAVVHDYVIKIENGTPKQWLQLTGGRYLEGSLAQVWLYLFMLKVGYLVSCEFHENSDLKRTQKFLQNFE